jgi:hypothetical protein
MGMHFGVIAAEGTPDELLGALASVGSFTAGAAITSFDDAPETDAAGEKTLIAGGHDGRAYLFDDSLILCTDPDLVIDASRRLGRRVLSAGAETTSGTYFLIAARSGRLERFHWNGLGAQTEPYDIGDPLPGEPADGLDDLDGLRLTGVLAAAGFDVDGWRGGGSRFVVDAAYGDPVSGPAGAALGDFLASDAVAGGDKLQPIVIKRGNGGFDLAAPGSRLPDGTRVDAGERKPGLMGRLFGRS